MSRGTVRFHRHRVDTISFLLDSSSLTILAAEYSAEAEETYVKEHSYKHHLDGDASHIRPTVQKIVIKYACADVTVGG